VTLNRLDQELVRRGLARSREIAIELINSGSVLVDHVPALKPDRRVNQEVSIIIETEVDHYVSRGAHKLISALDEWTQVIVENKICLDAGSSTGGFTQVLLERKAAQVFCVDVGYGQLAWEVRNHPQVVVMERTNIRNMAPGTLQPIPSLVVADLSFISLAQVLESLIANAEENADFLLMVKPQFEVGKESLGAGGVVRDPELRKDSIKKVISAGLELGLGCKAVVASALPGPKGNVEYFVWLKKGENIIKDQEIENAIAKGPQS
jgi:23S rRNA (cytidine1920-2'-O)/16S rRNA (cytidine1409-2'-O)-methyltransferase